MIKLREYQSKMVHNIRSSFANGAKRVILQLATGGGKTIIFTKIAKLTIEKGGSVMVITDRKELLSQTGSTFDSFGLVPEYLSAKTKKLTKGNLYVAMAETLKRRLNNPDYIEFIQFFDLIIIDEAHKASFDKLFQSLTSNQYVIGATATPYRNSPTNPLSKYYESLVEGVGISELINMGFLSPSISYGVSADFSKVGLKSGEFDSKAVSDFFEKTKMYDGVVENYKKHTSDSKALLFSADVYTSKYICSVLNHAGISAKHIDATSKDRDEILRGFKNNEFKVLCNVGILTTGYDEPSIETIILYRATMSLPLFLQMCGRGSRILPNKKHYNILDFGGNIERHGFWDQDRKWTLEPEQKASKKGAAPIKICDGCEAMIPANIKECEYCGWQYPTKICESCKTKNSNEFTNCKSCGSELKEPIKERIFAILEKLDPNQVKDFIRETASIEELIEVQKQKGYHPLWVARQCRTEEELIAFAKVLSPKKWSGWLYLNKSKYLK